MHGITWKVGGGKKMKILMGGEKNEFQLSEAQVNFFL
jgi:hypothetical protein